MLNADILLAENFLSEVAAILAQGKTVIEVTGGRGLQHAIAAAIDGRFRAADGTVSITTVELSRLWLANLHPQLMMHFVDGPHGTPFHPSHLYWGVGERGVIIRGFHLYPIAVKPPASRVRFAGTIDDDLVARIGASWDERFIAQDSRRLFCCELSPAEHHVGDVARRENLRSVINFYLGYARENVANLRHEIIITDEEELSEAWVTKRAESAAYAEALVTELTEAFRRRDVEREAALAEEIRAAAALCPPPPAHESPSLPGLTRGALRRLRSWLR
ncbi:hypothetical protein [Elioraea sp.]|uniref:hypothetical protein n=1 Tax=Elioraea sp. TaxID=2185103 RepID=UPI003F708ED1